MQTKLLGDKIGFLGGKKEAGGLGKKSSPNTDTKIQFWYVQ
jgi:hypothetical protein